MLFNVDAIAKLGGFEDTVVSCVMEHTVYLQHAVYEGRFNDFGQSLDLYANDGLLTTHINRRLLTATPPPMNRYSVADGIGDTSLAPFLQFGSLHASGEISKISFLKQHHLIIDPTTVVF